MNVFQPIKRSITDPQRYHESSRLRPSRDADAVTQAWKKDNRVASHVASLSQSVALLQRELSNVKTRLPFSDSSIGSSVQLAKIKTGGTANLANDYLTVNLVSWDGDTETVETDDTDVAVPPTLRVAETPTVPVAIEGSYSFAISPAYADGDYLIVASVPDGTGVTVDDVSLTWVDVTPGRAWGVKLPICIDGVTYWQVTHGESITTT